MTTVGAIIVGAGRGDRGGAGQGQVEAGGRGGPGGRAPAGRGAVGGAAAAGRARAALERAFALADRRGLTVTDEAALLEAAGEPVSVFAGSYHNLKITTPEDLAIAAPLLDERPPALEVALVQDDDDELHHSARGEGGDAVRQERPAVEGGEDLVPTLAAHPLPAARPDDDGADRRHRPSAQLHRPVVAA